MTTPDRFAGEEWRPIPGLEGRYDVSSAGRVRSWFSGTPRLLRQTLTGTGQYQTVRLGRGAAARVHRLVLTAFVGPCPDGHEGAHLDGDRLNNSLTNLAWVTRSENESHKRAHGTSLRRLTESQVREIRSLYDEGILTTRAIAAQFGMSQTAVMDIGKRKRWMSLPEVR